MSDEGFISFPLQLLSLSSSSKYTDLFRASGSALHLAVSHSASPLLICMESVRTWMQRCRNDPYLAARVCLAVNFRR